MEGQSLTLMGLIMTSKTALRRRKNALERYMKKAGMWSRVTQPNGQRTWEVHAVLPAYARMDRQILSTPRAGGAWWCKVMPWEVKALVMDIADKEQGVPWPIGPRAARRVMRAVARHCQIQPDGRYAVRWNDMIGFRNSALAREVRQILA